VVQWEIRAIDPEKMEHFYRTMFNWDILSGKKAKYIRPGIGAPEPQIAGAMLASERSGITLAIQVRDLRASMDRAVELGGKILREPFDVGPTPATFAWIADPEGNHLTLVQQQRRHGPERATSALDRLARLDSRPHRRAYSGDGWRRLVIAVSSSLRDRARSIPLTWLCPTHEGIRWPEPFGFQSSRERRIDIVLAPPPGSPKLFDSEDGVELCESQRERR